MKKIETYIQFESREKIIYSDVFDAVSDGNLKYLEKYIKEGNDINILQKKFEQKKSLLYTAIDIDFCDGSNLLLDNGIDVNLIDHLFIAINKPVYRNINTKLVLRMLRLGAIITKDTFELMLYMYRENNYHLSTDILYYIIKHNKYDLLSNNAIFWEYLSKGFHGDEILNIVKKRFPKEDRRYLVYQQRKKFNL